MDAIIDHENMHRTAKLFMDNGKAATQAEAIGLLAGFRLGASIAPDVQNTRNGQIALLTLVNAARRTFLGGIEIAGVEDLPLLVPLANAGSLRQAVVELGGTPVGQLRLSVPVALIGNIDGINPGNPAWRLSWTGWSGGVVPARDRVPCDPAAMPLAPVMAALTCMAEAFAHHAGDHPMAGRRACGLSLWTPETHWQDESAEGPSLAYLPSALWLIGMGNLGQAGAWILTCLPYADPSQVRLVLQDYDRITVSNDSTSVLSSLEVVGMKKTRLVGDWLEKRGFDVGVVEQHFGHWSRVSPHDPQVAFCGVDNALSRAALEKTGFGLVVEAGLGAGPDGFRNFAIHTFPSALSAERLWSKDSESRLAEVLEKPAYRSLGKEGFDVCGLAQLASRTVGVPYVGLTAAALAIAELLRRVNGGHAYQSLAGSLVDTDGIEAVPISAGSYAFGHLPSSGYRPI